MKSLLLSALLALPNALAMPSLVGRSNPYSKWKPAGPGDVRAPCPMLNTMANHGFINHSGKNITADQIIYAFGTYLNLNATLSQFIFDIAINKTAPPGSTILDLDYLNQHAILEHDGSLSRKDSYYGNNHIFDQPTFDQTLAYFTDDTITLQQAVNARLARMYTSNATNPTFNISDLGASFSFGETAAYLIVFGDQASATAKRSWVQYFFENERLPTSIGWSPRLPVVTEDVLFTMLSRVVNATGGTFPYPVPSTLNTGASSSAGLKIKRGFHGSYWE